MRAEVRGSAFSGTRLSQLTQLFAEGGARLSLGCMSLNAPFAQGYTSRPAIAELTPLKRLCCLCQWLRLAFSNLRIKPIDRDLGQMLNVVAEGIQTILRREGYPKPYETLKQLTRVNTAITEKSISDFIDTLAVSDEVKAEFHALSPFSYTGY